MTLKSTLLNSIAGIEHGFGDRAESFPVFALPQWEDLRPSWKQVHGTALAEVTSARQECGEVDALFTQKNKTPIAIQTADCVPVLMASLDGKSVAAVHAGWRGTRHGILRSVWDALIEKGHHPQDWVAAIGPCAGPCCYEVSIELAEDFKNTFGASNFRQPLASPRHLDLASINEAELLKIGVQQVDTLRLCTICNRINTGGSSLTPSWRFNSYRREGSGQRQWSVIKINTI